MELYLVKYINKMLKKADYEYDSATRSWCASVDELPGVYAQADSIEDVRSELAEIIEEYVFIPNPHGGKDIGIPLLKKIIRQIGITQDDFIKL